MCFCNIMPWQWWQWKSCTKWNIWTTTQKTSTCTELSCCVLHCYHKPFPCFLYCNLKGLTIVGFFILVSSLKVFGHSIHSERRGFILENQYKLYRMTPLSYHGYSVLGSSSQQCGGIPLKLLCLLSSIHVHHKNFSTQSVIKVPNQ